MEDIACLRWKQCRRRSRAAERDVEINMTGIEIKTIGDRGDGALYTVDEMYQWLSGILKEEELKESLRALPYARDKHEGQFRKPAEEKIPYFIHPLRMACQSCALGIREDTVLAAVLLHDVSEDCGIAPEELPFSVEIRKAVGLLTRSRDERIPKAERDRMYYEGIRKNRVASIVKVLDRCDNVSGMSHVFSMEKIHDYTDETETYVLPLLDLIRDSYPEFRDAAYLVKYQIVSILDTVMDLEQRLRG